jgi:hypothetical protein
LSSEKIITEILLSPNPASSSFTVSSNTYSQKSQIEIYNIFGETIFVAFYNEELTVNCENFPPGIYFVSLRSDNGIALQKLIKQ